MLVVAGCGQASPPAENHGVSGNGGAGGRSEGATGGSPAAGTVGAGAGGGTALGGGTGGGASGGHAGVNGAPGGNGGGSGSPAAGTGGTSTAGRGGNAGRGGRATAGANSGGRGGAANNGGMDASGGMHQGGAGSPGGSSSVAGSSSGGAAGGGMQSTGCGKAPTLKNSTSNSNPSAITISVSGTNREYAIRWPSDYDNTHPYRLILDLHGYGGTYKETAGEDYFGLWTPSNNTTIFIALSAVSTDWRNGDNLAYVDAVLKAVEADLCIDTSRVMLEGFSQGAAEVWQLACSRPGVFRAAVGHSGGGVTNPTSCMPIPYLGSGGLQESVTQTTQSDQFAKWNGCMVTTLPTAPSGGHVCTSYTGCPTADPVRWCNYDGPHTPLPTDSGKNSSWMPTETWPFFSQF
jgi:poly(3-hydroxybutyrate) depolymerase